MRDKLILNTEYSFAFGAYWMIYGIAGSFASVFMLAKGYSNMHIGMTLAVANLLSLVMQPFIADRMDRVAGIRLVDASAWMTAVMMLAGAGYFVFAGGSLMLAAAIAIILAMHASLQPVLNSLAFRLGECGTEVSFGICRAGGSLGFSAILAVLGTLVEKKGVMALPVCAEAVCAAMIALLFLTKRTFARLKRSADSSSQVSEGGAVQGSEGGAVRVSADGAVQGSEDGAVQESVAKQEDASKPAEERIDLSSFIRRNKYFFIMNLGVAGLFFSNAVLTNYMAQIAGNIGGTTEQVGRILSLMALLEMPTMIFFDKIKKHFKSRSLIKLAALGFTAKMGACWIAGSVGLLFAAQAFQLIAFALIMPAMVYFVDEIMSPGEAIKGQALFTMMITLATVAASFVGGWLIDSYGVSTLNLVSLIVTAAGAAVVIFMMGKVKACR